MTDAEQATLKEHIGYGICHLSRMARYLEDHEQAGMMAELLALSIRCSRMWDLIDDRPDQTLPPCLVGFDDDKVH